MKLVSVFVNGRPRPVIMQDMQSRIDRGDIKQERLDAIQVRLLSMQPNLQNEFVDLLTADKGNV
jgi:OHCU decarboxylase